MFQEIRQHSHLGDRRLGRTELPRPVSFLRNIKTPVARRERERERERDMKETSVLSSRL